MSLVMFSLAVWACVLEPRQLVVHEERLALPGWRGAPLRLVVLSDLHVGSPWNGRSRLASVVDVVNARRPDAIVLLGDYMVSRMPGSRSVRPEDIAAELSRLSAPCGVFAVLGNHDWWHNGHRVGRALTSAGLRVLENEAVPVERAGGRFWVAGLADLMTRWPDIRGTLRSVPVGEPVLLLTHEPDLFVNVPDRVALTLAGHTHGGQVRLPFLGAPVVPSIYGQRFVAGRVVEEGRTLFVTTGIGTSILPMRFRVPPEVVVLTVSQREEK
jgi:predicted MPP superfamily phosphohydrolase